MTNDLRSRNLAKATSAFLNNDVKGSIAAHNLRRSIDDEPHRSNTIKKENKFIKTIIASGTQGLIVSCIVLVLLVSGFSHDLLEDSKEGYNFIVVIIVEVVLATALATSFVEYMNKKSAIEFYDSEKKRETWEYDNFVEGERAEMVELYVEKGMAQNDAEQVVHLLSKYKDLFIDVMMAEELHLISPDHVSPLETAFSTFLSYSFTGILPVLPLIVSFLWPDSIERVTAFRLGVILTAGALLFFGYLKSFFTSITWWQIMIANVFNGLFGIGSAYLLRWIIASFFPSLALPPFFPSFE